MVLSRGWLAIRTVFRYAPVLASLQVILAITSAVFTPLQIYFTQRLVDGVTGYAAHTNDTHPIWLFGGMLVLSILIVNLFGYLHGTFSLAIRRSLTLYLSPVILTKLRNLEYACFESSATHDILERMSSNPQVTVQDTFSRLIASVNYLLTATGIVAMFFTASFWLGCGAIIIAAPMYITQYKATHMQHQVWFETTMDQRRAEYTLSLLSDKEALYELKVFQAIRYTLSLWHELLRKLFERYVAITKKALLISATSSLLVLTYTVFSILSLSISLAAKAITLGQFIAIIGSIGLFFNIMNESSNTVSGYIRLAADLGYYANFLTLPERQHSSTYLDIQHPIVQFENVCFVYPHTDRRILHNLSLTIHPHERVAFVGENGAGKSTIVKLLCGLYEPDSGKILVGGHELSTITDEQKRKLFSVVFQDFQSYQLTLRENIAFGDLSQLHQDETLINALAQAGAEELLGKSKLGLAMNLGKLEDDGVDLSKGQWQRVAMARAFVAQSDFAILDEPAASLDPIAESRMYEAFATILRGKGTIMISHRLASAKMADRIFVIEGGEVVEEGNHSELMTKDGIYCQMFRAQSSWYVDTPVLESALAAHGGEGCA